MNIDPVDIYIGIGLICGKDFKPFNIFIIIYIDTLIRINCMFAVTQVEPKSTTTEEYTGVSINSMS